MKRSFWALLGLVLLATAVVAWLFLRGCSPQPTPAPVEVPLVEARVVLPSPTPVAEKKPTPAAVKTLKKEAPPPLALTPPPVQLHKELIPKDVEIVRVYYANSLGAPGANIEFDINGSGFTAEFEKMIKAESGHAQVSAQGLTLMTPNQIHGTLVADKKAGTALAYPRVLIKGKVVFQAPDPFAIIRPGEVLNVIFVEMGESGRTGRFRVFTNLTPEMLKDFKVAASTPVIEIGGLTPALPFIVDGNILIGPAAGGEYGLKVLLKDKVLWSRDGIIRVVRPNVGQSGLAQRIQALDGFHRPGDKAIFALQGSGFRPEDVQLLQVKVKEMNIARSTFVYLAPGRMELAIWIPDNAPRGAYALAIVQGEDVLLTSDNAFTVVPKNWMREVGVRPKLKPGDKGQLILRGRDLEAGFVSKIQIQVDEPALEVGAFVLTNPEEALAPINVGAKVNPGDYLLHMSLDGTPVVAQFGNLIHINKND